jgi:alpha-ketoglutarate-dependent taurine dioxygenase|tara:strand:+ start:895 stop:1812 length:918 start_codon:yes stop_codon:yes gene_type:complete
MIIKKILDNTNGIEAEFNLLQATQEELNDFVKKIPDHHFILLRNVPSNKEKLVEAVNKMGRSSTVQKKTVFWADQDSLEITRVTNARDEEGKKTGLFADLDLCWHSNGGLREKVKQVTLMLHCVNPGNPEYGITGFCNMKQAYKELPNDVKELIETMEVRHSMAAFTGEGPTVGKNDGGYKLTPEDPEYEIFDGSNGKKHHGGTTYTDQVWKPLVVTHPWHGEKALYFIPSLIEEWRNPTHPDFNSDWLWNYLYDHAFQDKYIYKHKWQPGDMVFNDQYYGLHNRTEVKGERLLWRFCTDNGNIV